MVESKPLEGVKVLDPIIYNWTGKRTKKEAMGILSHADIPGGAIIDCFQGTPVGLTSSRGGFLCPRGIELFSAP